MNTPTLKFGSNELTVQIIFGDGKETDYFTSKSEVLAAFPRLIEKKRLTEDEALTLTKEVLKAEKLPAKSPRERVGSASLFEALLGGPFGPFGLGLGISIAMSSQRSDVNAAIKIFGEELRDEATTIEPSFKMCDCGAHGMILFQKEGRQVALSGTIMSKEDGREYIDLYKKENALAKETESKLLQELEESPLPATMKEVMEKAVMDA